LRPPWKTTSFPPLPSAVSCLREKIVRDLSRELFARSVNDASEKDRGRKFRPKSAARGLFAPLRGVHQHFYSVLADISEFALSSLRATSRFRFECYMHNGAPYSPAAARPVNNTVINWLDASEHALFRITCNPERITSGIAASRRYVHSCCLRIVSCTEEYQFTNARCTHVTVRFVSLVVVLPCEISEETHVSQEGAHSEIRSQRAYEIIDCAIDVRYRVSGMLLAEELGAELARECPIEIMKERSWRKKEERDEERDSSLGLLTRARTPFLSPRENSYFRRLFLAVHPHSAVGPRGTRCRNPEKETAGWWLLLIYGSINHIRHLHSAVANFARRRDHPAIFHLPRLRSRHGEMRRRVHPKRRAPLNFLWNSRTYGRLCESALRMHTRGDTFKLK